MTASTDKMPLMELYEALLGEFEWFKTNKDEDWFPTGKSMNDQKLIKLILQNNGCSFTSDPLIHENTLESVKDYKVCFIWGGKGNEIHEDYDYIEFFNYRHLIIFMDYFIDFFNEPEPIIGRSVYYDSLKQITDVFIETTVSAAELMGSLSTTAAANMYRFAGFFIAAKIIHSIVGLEEDDVSYIKYEDMMEMLDKIPFTLLLLGVKYSE